MNNESSCLETIKNLLSNKQTLEDSEVTTGSADERRWWPPYSVAPTQAASSSANRDLPRSFASAAGFRSRAGGRHA